MGIMFIYYEYVLRDYVAYSLGLPWLRCLSRLMAKVNGDDDTQKILMALQKAVNLVFTIVG